MNKNKVGIRSKGCKQNKQKITKPFHGKNKCDRM